MNFSEEVRSKLLGDAARALNTSLEEIPGDLSDKQVDAVFGLAKGTTAVKRCRGDFPIPSYKIGRARRTPLSAVIDYKQKQLETDVLAG